MIFKLYVCNDDKSGGLYSDSTTFSKILGFLYCLNLKNYAKYCLRNYFIDTSVIYSVSFLMFSLVISALQHGY